MSSHIIGAGPGRRDVIKGAAAATVATLTPIGVSVATVAAAAPLMTSRRPGPAPMMWLDMACFLPFRVTHGRADYARCRTSRTTTRTRLARARPEHLR